MLPYDFGNENDEDDDNDGVAITHNKIQQQCQQLLLINHFFVITLSKAMIYMFLWLIGRMTASIQRIIANLLLTYTSDFDSTYGYWL